MATDLCDCGCGYRLDDLSAARAAGIADARAGRPRRIDRADTSPIGDNYRHGYDQPDTWRYER